MVASRLMIVAMDSLVVSQTIPSVSTTSEKGGDDIALVSRIGTGECNSPDFVGENSDGGVSLSFGADDKRPEGVDGDVSVACFGEFSVSVNGLDVDGNESLDSRVDDSSSDKDGFFKCEVDDDKFISRFLDEVEAGDDSCSRLVLIDDCSSCLECCDISELSILMMLVSNFVCDLCRSTISCCKAMA